MQQYSKDPLYSIIKCEICPKNVTNFTIGACARCSRFWISSSRGETNNLTMDRVMATAIVSTVQEKTTNTSEFGQAIEQLKQQRLQKLEMFKMLRQKFQDCLLQKQMPATDKFELEEDYMEVDEINEDLQLYCDSFNLLNQKDVLIKLTSKNINTNKNNYMQM